jgi:hypothetical protein
MRIETTEATFSPPHFLSALLLAGDEGCAHAAPAVLAESARLLARCVASPAQLELEAVVRLAPVDMATAILRWGAATEPLRRALASTTREAA